MASMSNPKPVDVKKLGKELAKFAMDGGESYCWQCMTLWKKASPEEQNYALYKEALKLLYKTEIGQQYARFKDV